MNTVFTLLLAFALAQSAAEPPRHPAEIEALVDQARSLPPEFTADTLLWLGESKLISGNEWKRDLIEEAFLAANGAQSPYKRAGGVHTDTRPSREAWDNGLDAFALKARAVQVMLALDPERAAALFQYIGFPELPRVSCKDALVPDVSAYYKTLARVAERGFTTDQRAEGSHLRFVEGIVRLIRSTAQADAVAAMIFELNVSPAERQDLLNTFALALDGVPAGGRLFVGSGSDVTKAAWRAVREGYDVTALMPAARAYLVRQLRGPRCVNPSADDTGDPGEKEPRLSSDFNGLVQKLNARGADYRPISERETRPSREDNAYKLVEYWHSPRSHQVLESLRWLSHGNRDLPGDSRFWTLAERSTPEWTGRYLDLLKLLEGWTEDEEESPADYFHMKAMAYANLAKLLPPGPARDMWLRAYLAFLEQNYTLLENRNEWFTELRELLDAAIHSRDNDETAYLLDAMSQSPNQVISLYAKVENLAWRQ